MSERRSILLLCDDRRDHAGNVRQHIAALSALSRHSVYVFNPVDRPEAAALLDLSEFDVVAIHYTIAVWIDRYLPPNLVDKLAAFDGLTVQFIQDEYRSVDAVTARMRELRIDVLFTCVPEGAVVDVYGPRLPGVTTITLLPGYVPDELVSRETPALGARPIDVGYRARDLPPWLGRLGQEKVQIGRGFLERANAYGLRCDISSREEDRIYGEAWNRFLGSCRATLGTESGSSVIDFDGTLEARGKDFLALHPEASYEDAERELLEPYEGSIVINTASPRIFEAAALRTAMVLFRGEYSGIVEPDLHYIPLEKDFSNMGEVAERLRDGSFLESLVERAYADLIASDQYSLRAMVNEFDGVVSEHSSGSGRDAKSRYRRARFRRRVPSWRHPSKLRVLAGRMLSPVVGTALIASDRALRRVALAGLRNKEARAEGVGRDLWRLTALRYGVQRASFRVDVELDLRNSVLFFSSRPGSMANEPAGELWSEVSNALGGGAVDEIVWNHSLLDVSVGLAGGGLLAIPVGTHGVDGAHRFRALSAIAKSEPELVFDGLSPMLSEPVRGPRPETTKVGT